MTLYTGLKPYRSFKPLCITVLSACMLTGCFNDSDSSSNFDNTPTTDSEESVNNATLRGSVVDKDSLEPVANATIVVSGVEYISDEQGNFEIDNLATDMPIVVNIRADDYPESIFTSFVEEGTQPTEIEYQISNDDTIATTNQPVSQDINLSIPDLNAQVQIPANALERADGEPIVGNVIVTMDVITPSVDPEEMPGGYEIVGGGFMESFGALSLTAVDSDNNPLVLNETGEASLIIPVSTRQSTDNLTEQMPLYFYDQNQSGWVETGVAVLQIAEDGESVYTAQVDRLGDWNLDVAMDTVMVFGCVDDTDGNLISNAVIKGDGIDYSAITNTTSDDMGTFSLPVRNEGQLSVYAQSNGRNSNAISIDTNNMDFDLGENCLTISSEYDSLSIQLTWGEQPEDLDSHLSMPSGDHIYYNNTGSLSSVPYANLDIDDVSSFGPEFVTVRNLMVGRYHYGVENYSETFNPGIKESPVNVLLQGPTIRDRILRPSENENGFDNIFWHAFDLVVDEQCNITFERIDKWLDYEQSDAIFYNREFTEPTYCDLES